jgi:hypothetical protein
MILLVALALHGLLPTGFMLQASSTAAGVLEIVICTSTGAKSLVLDGTGTPIDNSTNQHAELGLCPYASTGAVALAHAETVRPAAQVEYTAVIYTLALRQFAETPKPGATSARGPPVQSV